MSANGNNNARPSRPPNENIETKAPRIANVNDLTQGRSHDTEPKIHIVISSSQIPTTIPSNQNPSLLSESIIVNLGDQRHRGLSFNLPRRLNIQITPPTQNPARQTSSPLPTAHVTAPFATPAPGNSAGSQSGQTPPNAPEPRRNGPDTSIVVSTGNSSGWQSPFANVSELKRNSTGTQTLASGIQLTRNTAGTNVLVSTGNNSGSQRPTQPQASVSELTRNTASTNIAVSTANSTDANRAPPAANLSDSTGNSSGKQRAQAMANVLNLRRNNISHLNPARHPPGNQVPQPQNHTSIVRTLTTVNILGRTFKLSQLSDFLIEWSAKYFTANDFLPAYFQRLASLIAKHDKLTASIYSILQHRALDHSQPDLHPFLLLLQKAWANGIQLPQALQSIITECATAAFARAKEITGEEHVYLDMDAPELMPAGKHFFLAFLLQDGALKLEDALKKWIEHSEVRVEAAKLKLGETAAPASGN